MSWYLNALKKYAVFDGRARRKEYWMFALFNFIISLALSAVTAFLNIRFISGIYTLLVFIPGLAVTIRRLHDVGKSGFFLLVFLIPVFGWVIMLYYTCRNSEPGANEYGLNPKEDPFVMQ